MNLIPWRNKHHEKATEIQPMTSDQAPLATLRSEMDRLFDRFVRDLHWPWGGSSAQAAEWLPAFDLVEGEKDITVRAELPGVDPKDVDVKMTGNLLTITGEKREASEERRGSIYCSERRFGKFQRRIELPSSVDTDRVAAEYANGVLSIRMPRKPGTMPKRITVAPK
jgi:HSP20 family protein